MASHNVTLNSVNARTYANPLGAFTLIEISIVLVIIGLIVSGVLVGRTLIRSAELRSVITDAEKFQTAMGTFRVKYSSMPGDFGNAQAMFGVSQYACPTGNGVVTYGTFPSGTCNGNENGQIDLGTQEMFLVWQHLALAGMIPGQYSGVQGAAWVYSCSLGWNCPGSRLAYSGYGMRYEASVTGSRSVAGGDWYVGSYGNTLEFGSDPYVYPVTAWPTEHPNSLSPSELQSLDTKFDDGLPASGHIMTQAPSYWPGCATSNTPALATYAASNALTCAIIFTNQGF